MLKLLNLVVLSVQVQCIRKLYDINASLSIDQVPTVFETEFKMYIKKKPNELLVWCLN